VSRTQSGADAGDLAALRNVEARLDAELARLDRLERHNDAIRRGSIGVDDEIRKARRELEGLLRDARATLRALDIAVNDEQVETTHPVVFARRSLPSGEPSTCTPSSPGGGEP
jgi:hypothetical protein